MDPNQQFCLRWNNYQSTLQHVFYKLWISGTFVDASLVVDGRRIDCHKVVLSACSSYFEDILQEHGSQSHPLILLHDMPFAAVEALVAFMYRGEVNVSHAQLESLLQVAEALKIKGLADSTALSNFTKRQFLERYIPLLEQAPAAAPAFVQNRFVSIPSAVTFPTTGIVQSKVATNPVSSLHEKNGSAGTKQTTKAVKRLMKGGKSPGPKRKRTGVSDRGIPSLPSSPIRSPTNEVICNDVPSTEPSQPSPPPPVTSSEMIKQEAADETDGELQIDESVGQSPEGSIEGDNSIGTECDKDPEIDDVKRATQEQKKAVKVENIPSPLETSTAIQQTQTPILENFSAPKERKSVERTYTHLDLEQGIEAVLLGRLTPAKAIAHYRIPRRTFFRRLSAVRKSRGIPSAKENAADQFLNTSSTISEANQLLNSLSNKESYTAPFKVKSETQLVSDTKEPKTKYNKKTAAVAAAPAPPNNSYFTLLKLAASNNYDTYIKYLRMVAQQSGHSKPEEILEALKKGHFKEIKQTVDDNRNVATEVTEAALCLVNKSLTTEVPDVPLSLVNGKTNTTEVPEGSEAPVDLVDENLVAEVPDNADIPVNLCNGNGALRVPGLKPAPESSEEEVEASPRSSPDVIRKSKQAKVSEKTQNIVNKNVTAGTTANANQNLISRNLTTEVS